MPQRPHNKVLRRYQRRRYMDRGLHLSSKNAKRNWVGTLIGITVLLSAGGVVASGAWLSYILFFNPNAIASLNQFLPPWAQLPSSQEPTQTLTQITAELSRQGKIAGEPLPLEVNANSQPASVILPVRSQNQIVELRVYRITDARNLLNQPSREVHYQFITQVDVTGPEESFVVAPLINPETADTSSNRPLPVTELRRFDNTTPTQGMWFYLWGQRQRGHAIAYGQIVHYNPDRSYLSLMLPWTSPTQPQWQQAIAGGSPELVIDQSVDLEPRLQVYQVKSANFIFDPLQLEPISIAEPALDSRDYQNALLIAQSGLWTPAEKWLQFIKQQRQKRQAWSSAAQAQLDFIRLHAKKAQKQANQTWASPSQQVLTLLIDGRWGEALKVFQASPTNTQEIATLLETDNGRIGNRVEVALRVNPNRTEVKAWGALLKGAQESRRSAIAWLKQQPQTTAADVAYIQRFLKRLEGDFSSNKVTTSHLSRFVGTAQQMTKVNPAQWLQIDQTPLRVTKEQTWYQIQLHTYHDGNTWQHAPFKLAPSKTAAQYWQQLGLNSDAEVQIVSWLPGGHQQIDLAVVKAVQLQGSTLKLLAVSDAFPLFDSAARQLALTKTTLQWLQPETIALSDLTQQPQPIEVAEILPKLWQELQRRTPNPQKSVPNIEKMLQQLGELPVQLIDLTGDGTAEVIMTISPQEIAAVHNFEPSLLQTQNNDSRSHTIIFSATGKIIYNEFSGASGQTMIAIAELEEDQLPALLVATGKNYNFKRWSTQHQRFN
ncbi:hypothetical protein Glo7428_0128 [Gloeocapsa sp. PCC 7428]|uniref:hypothetical protein n=1 Tax=Gloeocapsa sp. PCC 7428 TaxID=1173026 RepID=UPI0002A5FA26|nr:hypothetical protein [Gloeocapsa sp. PCC 7428]AFZ28743.1 hypothetical protein Glo7428_0128 [Gloeocapsa sp. PCC 7428]